MKITLISPYHGGSHRAWAEGYQAHSAHKIALLTLPARFWKWRMHGGAVTLARAFHERGDPSTGSGQGWPDLLLATDMLDLTTFVALTRPSCPTALYMHENQLTYPLPGDGTGPMRRQLGQRDQHYAFINYASMLAADRVFFNSDFHRRSFFDVLPTFLKHFPEFNELETIGLLGEKSETLPVGIDFSRLEPGHETAVSNAPPLVLWNQRWEYDKNPASFFAALYAMQEAGLPFRLALCGQNFRQRPAEFDEAIDRLGDSVIHTGYANDSVYRSLLWEAAVVISTAKHEFFGISILEAIHCQTLPILPHRLSYPELLPERFHLRCLYQNQGGLEQRLRWALTHPAEAAAIAAELATTTAVYDWSRLAPRYDARLAALLVTSGKSK